MDKQISRQFFNDKASQWDETVRNNDPVKLQMMAERLSFPWDARVLDVGSGTGVFVPYIQSRLNGSARVECMDFALRMLEVAQKKNGSTSVGHVCAEVETVVFAREVFDAAVCYSTFPHFHDKRLALENIFDLLKVGGKMYVCHTASRETINIIHHNIPNLRDHLIPEESEMRKMLAAVGFTEVVITDNAEYYLVVAKRPFSS